MKRDPLLGKTLPPHTHAHTPSPFTSIFLSSSSSSCCCLLTSDVCLFPSLSLSLGKQIQRGSLVMCLSLINYFGNDPHTLLFHTSKQYDWRNVWCERGGEKRGHPFEPKQEVFCLRLKQLSFFFFFFLVLSFQHDYSRLCLPREVKKVRKVVPSAQCVPQDRKPCVQHRTMSSCTSSLANTN